MTFSSNKVIYLCRLVTSWTIIFQVIEWMLFKVKEEEEDLGEEA